MCVLPSELVKNSFCPKNLPNHGTAYVNSGRLLNELKIRQDTRHQNTWRKNDRDLIIVFRVCSVILTLDVAVATIIHQLSWTANYTGRSGPQTKYYASSWAAKQTSQSGLSRTDLYFRKKIVELENDLHPTHTAAHLLEIFFSSKSMGTRQKR
jgi:hypothetical protein